MLTHRGLNVGARNPPTTSGQLLPFERKRHSVVLPPDRHHGQGAIEFPGRLGTAESYRVGRELDQLIEVGVPIVPDSLMEIFWQDDLVSVNPLAPPTLHQMPSIHNEVERRTEALDDG